MLSVSPDCRSSAYLPDLRGRRRDRGAAAQYAPRVDLQRLRLRAVRRILPQVPAGLGCGGRRQRGNGPLQRLAEAQQAAGPARAAERSGLAALALLLGVGLALTAPVRAEGKKGNAWSHVKTPAAGAAMSIGKYSAGCLQGAAELPLDGPGFQVMHPSRRRYFGHPDLVSFVQSLGAALKQAKLEDLMVGDLSQPRGGPAPGGHSSHQTGLDVDLWFWSPDTASHRALTAQERETTRARSVLDGKTSSIRAALSDRVLTLLKLTASDARVERIFVHPIIKRDACKSAKADRSWLHKLRPWYGHDDHFHVRLQCPADATDCVAQAPSPRGDGCAQLDWWFSPEAQEDRKKGRATYQAKVGKAPGMPEQCQALLAKPRTAATRAADRSKARQSGDAPDPARAGASSPLGAARLAGPPADGPAMTPASSGPGASL